MCVRFTLLAFLNSTRPQGSGNGNPTAYVLYSQLTSISEGAFLSTPPEDGVKIISCSNNPYNGDQDSEVGGGPLNRRVYDGRTDRQMDG